MLRYGAIHKELFGYERRTTNNRMEMMAAIQGLLALKQPCEVQVTTDSEYLLQGATRWMKRWKRRHWWKKGRPVRNVDLWMELDALLAVHKTEWVWTKGHASHADNIRCDYLAQEAARTQTSSWQNGAPHGPLALNLGPDYVPPRSDLPQSVLTEDGAGFGGAGGAGSGGEQCFDGLGLARAGFVDQGPKGGVEGVAAVAVEKVERNVPMEQQAHGLDLSSIGGPMQGVQTRERATLGRDAAAQEVLGRIDPAEKAGAGEGLGQQFGTIVKQALLMPLDDLRASAGGGV